MVEPTECFSCNETQLVCDARPQRPWSGRYACVFGAASIPYPEYDQSSWRAAVTKSSWAALSMIALGAALCLIPNFAAADQPKAHGSDVSSRQRCVCSTTIRPARVVRYRHYRIKSAYLIGYDPLPYRFGSTFVWQPPYRYYRH